MKKLILIVEDKEVNRELLSDWLEAAGFQVNSAENLEQAFAILDDNYPSAILLDVQLGHEDGLTLAAWIRRHPQLRNVPVYRRHGSCHGHGPRARYSRGVQRVHFETDRFPATS
jgi:CheY-like chemotaxis protein